MSVPTTIFIDTCIFDKQNYNFSSRTMSAFGEAAKAREMMLLLPDPTRREIERHIEERSQAVVKALREARQTAPFLMRWKAWPAKSGSVELSQQLRKVVSDEWNNFLTQLNVESLGYDGVNVEEVMNWYDSQRAPFDRGKKRKEFPDAFALAALAAYSKSKDVSVAIVSQDGDFRRACELHDRLVYFPSLEVVTEALLTEENQVALAKKIIADDPGVIVEEIKAAFEELGFYHGEDYEADIEDVEAEDVSIDQVNVVHVEGNQVTVAFSATVDYSAHVRADDHSTAIVDSSEDFYMVLNEYRGTIQDQTEVSGMATCSLSSDWKKLETVVELDNADELVCVEVLPEKTYRIGEDDD